VVKLFNNELSHIACVYRSMAFRAVELFWTITRFLRRRSFLVLELMDGVSSVFGLSYPRR